MLKPWECDCIDDFLEDENEKLSDNEENDFAIDEVDDEE